MSATRFLFANRICVPLFSGIFLLSFTTAATAVPQRLESGRGHKAAARLTPTGRVPAQQKLNLALSLPLRDSAALDEFLKNLYDPTSPAYHRYLTPAEFTERFGPTDADYQGLINFARSNHLTITALHPNRLVLDVEGSVADIEKAFRVNLRMYNHPTENRTFFAPDTAAVVDLPFAVLSVAGLDNFSIPKPRHHIEPLDTSTITPRGGSGPGGTYRGNDFRNAYVPGTSLTGAGQNVGLLQFDGYYTSDITSYETQTGLPNVNLINVAVDGGVSSPGNGNSEVCLDIESVIAMAPGVANIYVYEAPNPSPWVDLLSRMANDNLCKQFGCSWGGGSPDAASEQIFKQMGAQGQSFFAASGDADAFTAEVDFPNDSTNITQVGGTVLTTGSGASYISETVWNRGGGTGSSGGVSTFYGIPWYQAGIDMSQNGGSTLMRNIPDVALTAENVYVTYGNGTSGAFGGTSCAAPLWAGFCALVNQKAVAAGRPTVGFINPVIYSVGKGPNYSSAFHDIKTGNNAWSSSPTNFFAKTGYDLCTGWGSPAGTNLINLLANGLPIVLPNSFALATESCTNGVIDSGETVTVNFGLKNMGTLNASNLIATLQTNSGILLASGPQSYGLLSNNGSVVTRSFTFTAVGSCGSSNIATLQLQDGTNNLGTVNFGFQLGQPITSPVFSQYFDGVAAPGLPAGWTTSASGGQSPWVTSTTFRDTAPNSVFSTDAGSTGENELDSPVINLPAGQFQLRFRHRYDLEPSYDGGVLEISIAGGAWTDVVSAGGSMVSGGYVGILSTSSGNPLGGRAAWTGTSGAFVTTLINLPSAVSGQSIQLRWRCGTDQSANKTGWYVDTIALNSVIYSCCASAPTITTQPQSLGVPPGSNATFNVTASGTYPLTYQWRLAGTNITGATATSYTRANVQAVDLGDYTVVVSNNVGSVTSAVATLSFPAPFSFQPVSFSAGNVMLSWGALNGRVYQLQSTTNLTLNNWSNVGGPITANSSTITITDPIGPDPQRFYRAVLLP